MDNIPLRLRSFKLYLTIPEDRRSRLPEIMTLIYLPRINDATPLEINGVKILHNTPAPITLRRHRSAEAPGEWEVVFASKDRVYAGDGLSFEVYIGEAKALKGNFRRGMMRWGMECEAIGLAVWAEVSVMTDRGFLMRERVKRKIKRFCPRLPMIPEEDEEKKEEEDEEEMGGSDAQDCPEKKRKSSEDGVGKKGINWAVNVGVLVACLGVGLFISRTSFKRLVRMNLF